MPDEKIENAVQPTSEAPKEEVKPEEPSVAVKKSDPTDELGDTLGQFLSGMQAASLISMKSMLAQFKTKADAVLTKLDGGVGGDPPKT